MDFFSVSLYVSDVEKAKAFWVDQCGLKVKTERFLLDRFKLYSVGQENRSMSLQLVPKEMMKNSSLNIGCPSVLFEADDLKKAHKELKDKGVKVLDIEEHIIGKVFTFFDSEGNNFAMKEAG